IAKVAAKISVGTSAKPDKLNSDSKSTKASFVGANTVKGAGLVPFGVDSVLTNVNDVSRVNADTNTLNVGSAKANVTTVGKPITASTTCTTPLVASISGVTTLETPFNLTPEAVFINMLKFNSVLP